MEGEANKEQGGGISLGHVVYVLLRHRRALVAGAVIGVLGAAAVFFITPTVYRSEAKLLVRYISDTTVMDPVATGGRIISPDRYGDNIINSEIEIFSSRDLVEQIVDEIGLAKFSEKGTNPVQRFEALLMVVRNLHVEVPKRSNVIRIYYDARNPVLAQTVLSTMVGHYLKKHVEIHRAAGAYDFLSQQTDQIRARLTETEEELRRIKNDAGIVSIDEAKRALLVRIEELNRSLQEAQGSLASSEARMHVIHPMLPTTDVESATSAAETNDNSGYVRTFEKLARLQDRELELLSTYTEDSIPVQNIRSQIEDLKGQLGSGVAPGRNLESVLAYTNMQAVFMAEEASQASLQAQITVLQGQIADAKGQADKLDEIEGRVVLLERNRDIQAANYKYFAQSLEQARIDDALDSGKISNISIVQPASFPAERLRPNLIQNLALALALGLLSGIAFSFLHENVIDHSVRRPSELADGLGIPLLISIPWAGGNGAATSGRDKLLLPPHADKSGDAAESVAPSHEGLREYFNALRDRLSGSMGALATMPCVIGVTSCSHGAGVTTTSAGLAVALAQEGEDRVLLVDAGGPHRVFGVNPTGGLVDIVADGKGNTAITEHNLYFLHQGQPGSDMVMNLTRRYRDVVEQMKMSHYSYVILDLPPITETSPTLRIAGLLNGVVLVIEAEKDHREAVRRAKDLLLQANANLKGAVLNKTRSYVPAWLHPEF